MFPAVVAEATRQPRRRILFPCLDPASATRTPASPRGQWEVVQELVGEGGREPGERRAAGASGRLPRGRRAETSDLGFVGFGVVPRPMRHNRHGLPLWGGSLLRLTKPQRDGASSDLRAAPSSVPFRPAFRCRRKALACHAEAGCRGLHVYCCNFLFTASFLQMFMDTCPS